MRGSFWNFWSGAVRFEIQGGQGERFLNSCAAADIPVQCVVPTPTGFMAQVPARDYTRLHRLARKARCRLNVRERKGLCFTLLAYRHRWGMLVGLALAVLALLVFPKMIWNIEFYQFTPAQEAALRRQLYEKGVYEGAFADMAQLRRIADGIFVEEKDYSWVSLNFVKGRLVAEKRDKEKTPAIISTEVTDLVATSSGLILSVDLRGGFLQKWPNQSVAEGEVLVSGASYNDQTQITAYAHSEGSVFARVEKTYTCTQPLRVQAQRPSGRMRHGYRLLVGGGAIPPGPAPEQGPDTETAVTREGLSLWGFHLPATLEHTRVRQVQPVEAELSPELAAQKARMKIYDALREKFPDYKLEDVQENVEAGDGEVTVTMRLTFVANIAKEAPFSGLT